MQNPIKIKSVFSRKILNSASQWTIETEIELEDKSIGTASSPGGMSKGEKEVATISADEAIERVGEVKKELEGKAFESQQTFDELLIKLDGTNDKSKLGGNTILSLSIAFCKATAQSKKLEVYEYIQDIMALPKGNMPKMMMLILEGGVHGSGTATIQEFMAIVDSIERGDEIYDEVGNELRRLGKSTNVGAEGAYSPSNFDNDQMLSILSGYLHGEKIAIDVASSSFVEKVEYPNYDELLKVYPIFSVEDPYKEDDWTNWQLFAKKHLSGGLQIVADDLTTTNPRLLKKAIEKRVANAIIIKPNQIGSVTETLEVVKMAQEAKWKTIVSHRGTDTNDDFIADLAVGINSEYVKFGAPARGERVAKYNRLLEIGLNPNPDLF